MKRLLALLVACTTITCIFASCGEDEKKESSASGESSVSEESSEEETTTETSVEEVTTKTEENEETEPEQEEDTESVTNENSDNSDSPSFLGKWNGVKAIVDGEEVNNISGFPAYVFQIDFQEDGKVLFGDLMTELINESDYTWSMISDNEIEVVDESGMNALFIIEGDYLVSIENGNDKIYLSKVDEFTAFGDADMTAFLGKWEGEKAIIDGEEVTDVDDVPLYAYQFDFKDNGKVLLGDYLADNSNSNYYFYNLLNENQIEMIYQYDDKITFTVDGDYLVATEEDYDEQVYLVRVDEFTPVSDLKS